MAFLEDEVRRGAVGAPVEAIAEGPEEAALLGLSELAHVEDGGQLAVDELIGDELAGGRVEWDVAVAPTKNGDGEAG